MLPIRIHCARKSSAPRSARMPDPIKDLRLVAKIYAGSHTWTGRDLESAAVAYQHVVDADVALDPVGGAS